MKLVLCDNCEGTGREYPYGEQSMRCQEPGCRNGYAPATLATYDGQVVECIFGRGVLHHFRKMVWIIEEFEEGSWILVNPSVDDFRVAV